MIQLRALGTAEILTPRATITPSQKIVFAAALYLIVERGKPVGRARLSSMLWPAIRDDARTHRLRQTVYQLKTLGIPVYADRNVLKLRLDEACADFERLSEKGLQAGASDSLFECLPNYVPRLSETFQDWLDAVRERVHSDLTRELLGMLTKARNSALWDQVERIARSCLQLDPYNEAAVLARAEGYAMRGQKATAVSILDRHVADLGQTNPSLTLSASVLRRRVLQNEDRIAVNAANVTEPEFVGRGPEMAELTKLIERARKGFGGGCLIEGEAGIGKSRLSSEIARFAELQGLQVERVGCKRADEDQPLSVFVTLIPRLREMPGALGCSRSSFLWLKRLTEFDTSSQELPSPAEEPATLYTQLRSAIFDLLDAVSDERCLLVIVEDVHWLDRASAKLFGTILEWAASRKIFFLFNSRETPNPLTDSAAKAMGVLHLNPLENVDAVKLIQTLIAKTASTTEQPNLAWLLDTGDGNPYFLQELAKHWLESRQRDVPPSVASVLDERLSRLSDVARQLLQACAVLGEHSNLPRLEQVLEFGPQDLLTGIQELSSSGMLRSSQNDGLPTQDVHVRHDLLSMEVLRSLAPASLAFLHRRCGVVLEREVFGSSISISSMRACAFHWFHSGDSERAYGLALKCADHLLEIGLAADAATAFEGALSYSSTPQRQLEILARIIQANRLAVDRLSLLKTIARFRFVQESLSGPSTHHDDIEIIEFDALRTTQVELAPVLARTVTCVYDACLPAAHRVKVAVEAVKLASAIPDLKEMSRIHNAVEPFLQADGVDVRSRLQIQVIFNTMCGDLRCALQYARERLELERNEGTTSLLLNSITDLAIVLTRAGPAEEALAVLREAYTIATERKHYAKARECAERFASLLEEEELSGSKQWMERAARESKEAPDVHSEFSFNADSVRMAIRENRLADARQILERGFDWEWLNNRRMWLASGLALQVRLLIAERAKPVDVGPYVEKLGGLFESTASLGRQDYEVAALIQGLTYVGKCAEAKLRLKDFILRKRRDLTPLSRELSQISEELQAHHESTGRSYNLRIGFDSTDSVRFDPQQLSVDAT